MESAPACMNWHCGWACNQCPSNRAVCRTGLRRACEYGVSGAVRIVYQHDHTLTRLMGRPTVDLLLDLDTRKRPELRGFALIYIMLFTRHESRRVARLDTETVSPRTGRDRTRTRSA